MSFCRFLDEPYKNIFVFSIISQHSLKWHLQSKRFQKEEFGLPEPYQCWTMGSFILYIPDWEYTYENPGICIPKANVVSTCGFCRLVNPMSFQNNHDDVIKWKHFLCYWPFVWGIHRWPMNSPHKAQWRGALIFDQRLNNRLSKQSWGRWSDTPAIALIMTSL